MDKKQLSERDICTKFITPAIKKAGWDEMSQIREEVGFTKGRIIVRGKMGRRWNMLSRLTSSLCSRPTATASSSTTAPGPAPSKRQILLSMPSHLQTTC